MKRVLIALALIAAIGGAGWYWGSPVWTLRSMKDAAERRDVDALSRNVDYAALRESMKRQLRARAVDAAGEMGVLGSLVNAGVADRLVDLALTPEGMRAIFAAAPLASTQRPGAIKLNANDMVTRRDGIGRFRLVRKDGKGGALIFRLRGATWMLTDVELPPGPLV